MIFFKHFQHSRASLHMGRGGSAECHTQVFSQLGLVPIPAFWNQQPCCYCSQAEGDHGWHCSDQCQGQSPQQQDKKVTPLTQNLLLIHKMPPNPKLGNRSSPQYLAALLGGDKMIKIQVRIGNTSSHIFSSTCNIPACVVIHKHPINCWIACMNLYFKCYHRPPLINQWQKL